MGRETNRLTVVRIKAARAGRLEDGGGLRLDRGEARGKWVYRYTVAGTRREMGLGAWPEVSLAEARRERDRWAAVLRGGKDPISERRRALEETRRQLDQADPTLAEATTTAFDARKSTLRGAGERGRWLSPLNVHILPSLGRRRISTIHQGDIREALRPIWTSKSATAEKAAQRLRIVLAHAKLCGCQADPAMVDTAIAILGTLHRDIEHIEATPWERIPDLYRRLDGRGASRAALRLMILTAVRSHGVRGARIEEIKGDVWTVPAERIKGSARTVQDFRVPLSAEALRVIERAAETSRDGYLFPSYRKGHISSTAIASVLNNLGEPGRPHGLRTSFRTWVQDAQAATYDVAETALGHLVGGKVERSYARSDLLDQRRALMAAWAEYVTREIGGDEDNRLHSLEPDTSGLGGDRCPSP